MFLPNVVEAVDPAGIDGTDAEKLVVDPHKACEFLPDGQFLVDTHCHAHLERDSEDSPYQLTDDALIESDEQKRPSVRLVMLSCAVQYEDWGSCVKFASQSTNRVAALGIHPWYCEVLPNDWLHQLEQLVRNHPGCLIGEIGLCRVARWVRTHEAGKEVAMNHQRSVFVQQLELAAKYDRPVSVHCVSQQGVLLNSLLEQEKLPPRIALHSFTGTAHHVKQLLSKLEGRTTLYFGFSHIVNYAMCSSEKSRRLGKEAVCAVPFDRILVESDVHQSTGVTVGVVGAIAYVAWCRKEPIETVARQTTENGLQFLKQPFDDPQ